jgi:hypothetical protein
MVRVKYSLEGSGVAVQCSRILNLHATALRVNANSTRCLIFRLAMSAKIFNPIRAETEISLSSNADSGIYGKDSIMYSVSRLWEIGESKPEILKGLYVYGW